MLKKLRLKFIALNMAMVAVVLAVVLGGICAAHYQSSHAQVTHALDRAIESAEARGWSLNWLSGEIGLMQEGLQGAFGGSSPYADSSSSADQSANSNSSSGSSERDTIAPPEIGGTEAGRQTIPVAVFAVLPSGTGIQIPQANSATISSSVLEDALTQTASLPDGSGQLDAMGLFYSKSTVSSGYSYVAFADMETASGWQSLLVVLVLAGLGALLVFLVISVFFSRWALRPVEQAWNEQNQFLADASHELKTPLTVILANMSIALKNPSSTVASQNQWLEGTQHEAENMQHLVNDMLTLAKADAAHSTNMKLLGGAGTSAGSAFSKVDFSTLAESSVLQFESVAFEQGLSVEDHVQEGLFVQGDEAKLGRLLGTLLDNACKYAAPASVVTMRCWEEGSTVRLSVQNFGNTVAPEDLPHLFDRFYRTDKARTRTTGNGASSHGLGLAIAQGIATEHGGSIAVTSTEAKGTTFTVSLPLAR